MVLCLGKNTNYVLVTNKSLGKELFCDSNSYYVVRDVVDLHGATITIPNLSVIKFEGGKFTNGKVIGTDTYIEAAPYAVFAKDLDVAGTFLAGEAYPEWFEGDDDAIAIRKALELFENVKLTAKHYFLRSVDSDGYGIVVPTGRILQGNRRANNTINDDQIIEMVEGIKYKSIIGLYSRTSLSNLTIHGKRGLYNACVSTVDGFQSRITIERVGVSSSYYGFNLQTYLSNITQCVANFNDIGFFIHGKCKNDIVAVEGTSINLTTCFAVSSKITGYELMGITYSTMNNCAADGCGNPITDVLNNVSPIGYSYSFTHSRNITANSCGAEETLGAVKTYNCKNIIFNCPSYLISRRKNVKVDNSYKLKPIFNIRFSEFIVFNYMSINCDDMKNYFDVTTPLMVLHGREQQTPAVIIKAGYESIKDCNIAVEGFLVKTKNLLYSY